MDHVLSTSKHSTAFGKDMMSCPVTTNIEKAEDFQIFMAIIN